MATIAQIRESKELAKRSELLQNTVLFEVKEPQPEGPSATATHSIRTLLRAVTSVLIAPVLVAAALVVFLFALADFSWFRLQDLRNGPTQPKGLWEF
jgi:hypothetical protein